jgi:PmbA protein
MKAMDRACRILEVLKQVSTASEVNWIHRRRNTIVAGIGSPVLGSGAVTSYSVRIQRNGRAGTSGAQGEIHPAVLAEEAICSARSGPDFDYELPSGNPPTEHFENRKPLPASEEVLEFVNRLSILVEASYPGTLLSARISWGRDLVGIINSMGLSGEYVRTKVRVDATVSAATSEGLYRRAAHLEAAELPSPGDAMEWLFPGLRHAGNPPENMVGRKTAVFAPPALGVLLQAVRTGVSGRVLLDGASPLAGKQGEEALSPLLTVRESPLHASCASSAPFDTEGIATDNKVLFRKGVFNGFIYDLASGFLAGLPSTGNAGKNLGGHPVPVCTNLLVDAGSGGTLNDMIARVPSGVLVSGILSAEGSDAAGGEMLLDCGTAWAISRGEVTGRLSSCLISGSAYDILAGVTDVGGHQGRAGTDLLPPVTSEGVRIR